MVQRPLILATLAMILGAGCNAGSSNNQVRQPPPLAKEPLQATRIIALINKNSENIKSLESEPAIEASTEGESHNLRGRMRMERDKDFRLYITALGRSVADIGSNEKGFWFWVKDQDKKENNIYVCDYEHVASSRLAVTMQPEWIMEAMGLREINPREAATIDARPGEIKGQLLLTQLRKGANGATYTKETLVNESNGEIIEHRLYSGASNSKKELLARATIKSYKKRAITPKPGDEEIIVLLPDHFTLEWVAEKFKLDITMGNKTQINPRFSKETVAEVFAEPTIPGANRIDLATIGQTPASTSRIYESMPMPRSGIRLGQPQAISSDEAGTVTRSSSPRSNRSSGLSDLPTLPGETTVVGPSIPQGSSTDPSAVQAAARGGWQRPVFEN
jgi:hypothetical protein